MNWHSKLLVLLMFGVFLTAKTAAAATSTWNTFLGTASVYSTSGLAREGGNAIAADTSGNVYVTGCSQASWGTPISAYTGGTDIFVAKISKDGVLLWNTFLGSASDDEGSAIAVDSSGSVYVTGVSKSSWGSPIRAYSYTNGNPLSGGVDAFVVKLSNAGVVQWNTFLGSNFEDWGSGIVVSNTTHAVFVVGSSGGYTGWGTPTRAHGYEGYANIDAFVARVNEFGVLEWNTFLGAGDADNGNAIALNSNWLSVTGNSQSTWETPKRAHSGGNDAFVAQLNTSGLTLNWVTFLGAANDDYGRGVIIPPNGNGCVVTGESKAGWGAPARAYSGNLDVFVAHVASDGTLDWNTFLGSTGTDYAGGLSRNVYDLFVVGTSFGTWGSPVQAHAGGGDISVARLNPVDGSLVGNTFMGSVFAGGVNLGRLGEDWGLGIADSADGKVFVAGTSWTAWGTPLRAFSGTSDAVVAAISGDILVADSTGPTVTITSPTTAATWTTSSAQISVGGTASDVSGVSSVAWSTDRGQNGSCTGTILWSCSINLLDGVNNVTITAVDTSILNNSGADTLQVTRTDVTPPVVTLASPTSGSTWTTASTPLSIGGTASDSSGIASVAWSTDRGTSGSCAGTTSWSCSVNLVDGVNNVTITARDTSNNPGTDTLQVTANLAGPVVTITGPTSGSTWATASTPLSIGGTASDSSGIASVAWSTDRGQSGSCTGTTAWSCSVTLLSGTNNVTVTAQAGDGSPGSDLLAVTYTPAAGFRLPDTGQDKCYQAVTPWAEIPCAGTGQDGAYLHNPMSYSDNNDGTVTDTNTGLIWRKCSHGYSYAADACSYVPGMSTVISWSAAQAYCTDFGLEWRLPTKKELVSIVDYGISTAGPKIDPVFDNTDDWWYWTSTPYASSAGEMWRVSFYAGNVGGFDSTSWHSTAHARCVSGGQPSSVLVDNGNGTVSDTKTGLIWQKCSAGLNNDATCSYAGNKFSYSWSEALSYCEGLNLGGSSAWRLPNIRELESLTDDQRTPPINDTVFPGNFGGGYWSSTTFAYAATPGSGAWFVWFGWIRPDISPIGKDAGSTYCRCVRSGPALPALPAWRTGEVDAGGGWKWTNWFGYYNINYLPWVYHAQHGWLYPYDNGSGAVFFWYSDMNQFVWTTSTTYPFLYRFDASPSWLWYVKGSASPRKFYDYGAGVWENLP